MTDLPQIKNLEQLLQKELQAEEKIASTELSRLTAPGENYGSLMLRVLVTIRNTVTGAKRLLDAVGKLIPESENTQEIFNTQVTYKSEYNFYAVITPTLDQYLKSKGFPEGADYAAPFLGGRINLDGSSRVDQNAVILLKNLRSAGYSTGKKSEGLNVQESKLVLAALAKLHSAGIGLRHQHPKVYEEKFRPHYLSYDATVIRDMLFGAFKKVIESDTELTPDQIQVAIKGYWQNSKKENINEHWGTMIHYDTWTNNILIKRDEKGNPIHCILVDFQVIEHGSPLNDVMFFLFSSLQQEPFETALDELLEFYYVTVTRNLLKMGLDLNYFTKESFHNEIRWAVTYEYMHTMWMLLPLMNEAFKSVDQTTDALREGVELSEGHVNKLKAITRMCFKKGWM